MSEKKSFSDYVREYILDTHQKDPKYFETTSVSKRNSDFSLFCTTNKSKGLDYTKHRSLFTQLLGKIAKDHNIKLQKQLSASPQQKYQVTKGLQSANVTVKPTQTRADQSQQTAQATQGTAQQSQQTGQKTEQVILHPPMCQCVTCKSKRGELSDITAEEAGGILEIIIDFWHSRNPKVEPMTPEEVEKVGKRLQPILQRHLGGDVLFYGMALISVGQVVMRRVDQAKASKKDKIEQERDKANEKTSQEQKQERNYSDTPAPKSDTEQINRKFYNSSKIKEIMELKDDEDGKDD